MKKTKIDVLFERDQNIYGTFTSEKAKLARKIAMQCEFFLPYFVSIEPDEESNLVGFLFGLRVTQ